MVQGVIKFKSLFDYNYNIITFNEIKYNIFCKFSAKKIVCNTHLALLISRIILSCGDKLCQVNRNCQIPEKDIGLTFILRITNFWSYGMFIGYV